MATPAPPTPATATTTTEVSGGGAPLATATSSTTVKSGWLTSEHALSLIAMLLTAGYTTGAIPTDGLWAKLAAVAAVVLISLGYTVSRTMVKLAALALILFFGFGTAQLTACGTTSTKATATDTVRATYQITKVAEATFVTYDHDHQLAIIAAAKTPAEADAGIAAYLKKRAVVVTAFRVAYDAEAAAAALANDPKSLGNIASAYSALFAALKDLGVKL